MKRPAKANPPKAPVRAIELPVPVVLGSRSVRRRRLLRQIVRSFEVIEPLVDESRDVHGSAETVACARAQAKARDVARRRAGALVIGADPVVECRGEIIGKPRDRQDARRILARLTTFPHRVVTGLCVLAPDGRRRCVSSVSEVRMERLSPARIEEQLQDPEVLNRAGAYDLREPDPNVASLKGSPSSVMGLPLEELQAILLSLYPCSRQSE